MNNRRKFLLQSGMAATAVLVTKPYKAVASITNPLIGFGSEEKLMLLHTGNTGYKQAVLQINTLKQQHKNVMLLHTGIDSELIQKNQENYDVIQEDGENGAFKIIYKRSIKIGVINTVSAGTSIKEINDLTSHLKKEKYCDIVVCLSRLGYKNKQGLGDVTLAEQSVNLDIILSGHAENFSKNVIVVLNKKKEEVIISHSAGNAMDLGNIEINFDKDRQKRRIDFHEAAPSNRHVA